MPLSFSILWAPRLRTPLDLHVDPSCLPRLYTQGLAGHYERIGTTGLLKEESGMEPTDLRVRFPLALLTLGPF